MHAFLLGSDAKNKSQTMRHITFANKYYKKQARQLRASANKFGLNTTIFSEKDITELCNELPWVNSNTRGFGYWVWKPYIIVQSLSSLSDGELLLYTDAGILVISDPRSLVCCLNDSDIASFELHGIKEREWTKRTVMEELNTPDDQRKSWQRSASYILFRRSEFTVDFCETWLEMCKTKHLVDNTALPNDFAFKFHRNDQSLFSLLAKQSNVPSFRDPSQFGLCYSAYYSNSDYPQIFCTQETIIYHLEKKFREVLLPKSNEF